MEAERALRNLEVNELYHKRLVVLDRSNTNRALVLQSASLSEISKATNNHENIMHGTIHNLAANGNYGFITDLDGKRWFFHAKFMKADSEWNLLEVGSQILFRIGQNAKGLCAVDIAIYKY